MNRRHFLTALPALAMAPRLAAQATPASLKVNGLSQLTLTVSDVGRSLKFYQDLFGMGVEDFSVDRVVRVLGEHGVMRTTGDGSPAPMTAHVAPQSVFVGDPSGIVFQLHDVNYCGGGGVNGTECRAVEASPTKGLLSIRDMSHFTVGVADTTKTVAFYQGLGGA